MYLRGGLMLFAGSRPKKIKKYKYQFNLKKIFFKYIYKCDLPFYTSMYLVLRTNLKHLIFKIYT